MLLLRLAIWLCAIVSLWRVRSAYIAFVALSLFYFPASVGFHLDPRACQFSFDVPLALSNRAHMVLFAILFMITVAQFRDHSVPSLIQAALLTLVIGALLEAAQGITGQGHCRARDLIPDSVGALGGAIVIATWDRLRTKWQAKSTADTLAGSGRHLA